jgi:hypothetical protein
MTVQAVAPVRTGRRAEIGLLVFAVLIVTAAEAVVEATRVGHLSSDVACSCPVSC